MDSWHKYIEKFNRNDEESIQQMIPNDEAYDWIEAQVPKFECPDKTIEETYYFRWWTFRKHIKETPKGRIITEFLPEVSWAGPFNSINAASGHHIAEARWLVQDRSLAKEYILFWLKGEGDERSYSSWIVFSVYQYALVVDDKDFAISLLPQLEKYYERVKESNLAQCGLFWSDDDRDAMERSISGCGLRPTLNSYMFANAYALARIAKMPGITCMKPDATFLLFPDISATGMESGALVDFLIEKVKLALVPGTPKFFGPGAAGHIRICLSTSQEVLEEGMNRLQRGLELIAQGKTA